jgi:hypothetical protein
MVARPSNTQGNATEEQRRDANTSTMAQYMSESEIDSGRRKYDVQLHHQQFGPLGAAKLQFGGNGSAYLNFSAALPAAFVERSQIDLLRAVTDDGTTFSLCVCKVTGPILSVDYVIEADLPAAQFNSISVRYSEVSEWFLHWQNVEWGVGKTLTWTQIPQGVDVTVKTEDEHFQLRSEIVTSSRKQGEDLVLHEHVEFIFSAKDQRFGPQDLKLKTLEFSCLLSILLGYPATVTNVAASHGTDDRFYRVHFPSFERPERDRDDASFWIRCFIQQPALEGRWQFILDQYYQSRYRKVCWVRLAGMQRYDDFWEYKVLGYVSLLDSYLSIRFKGKKKSTPESPSARRLARFQRDVAKELPTLAESQLEKIAFIADRSFAVDGANFGDKYRLAIAATNRDIVKIIALSDKDFARIKKIRNKIAHGDDHGLRDGEFTAVIQTEAKITLLLTYWAFLDFGLTTQDFIKCLNQTHSKLRFVAALDTLHLSRVSGSAEFFPVTMEKLRCLRGIKGVRSFACCILEESGELNYSEVLTKVYKAWFDDRSRASGVIDAEIIFGVGKDGARVVGHGYFECGDERLEVHQMWIVKRSALPDGSGKPG